VTDDTAAIQAAVAAFEKACLAGQSPFTGHGASVLYLPAGNYLISDTLVVSGIPGGIIEGDGKFQTRLVGTGLGGKAAMLQLVNCRYTTVRNLDARPEQEFTEIAADAPAGSTRVRVKSTAGLHPGQRIGLAARDRTAAELLTIALIAGDTVTTTTPTIYAYAANRGGAGADYLASCVFSVFQSFCRYDGRGPTPSQNLFENCHAGSDRPLACLFGFSTDCLGGGPTYLTQPATAGNRSIVVFDAGRLFAGAEIQFWPNTWTEGEVAVVASLSGNEVTLTKPLSRSYPSLGYVLSRSDVNNELHTFIHCQPENCVVAGWDVGHLNSLDHQLVASHPEACFAGVACIKGGSFSVIGMANGALGVDFVLGGPMVHTIKLYGVLTESHSKMLFAHPSYHLSMLCLDVVNYDKKGGPPGSGQRIIDLTGGPYMLVSLAQCNVGFGAGPGQIEVFMADPSGTSQLNLSGGCNLGCYGYTLAGVAMKDFGSNWAAANPLVETLSQNATVEAVFATYGPEKTIGLRRVPPARVALAAGTVHDLALPPTALVEVTSAEGPVGPVTITGFRGAGAAGSGERELVFEFAQRITIKHLDASSAPGNRVHCPGGADLTLAGPCALRLKFSRALGAWIVLSHG
jgi:hypothetical protein